MTEKERNDTYMPDIIERLKRGHQGSGIGPLDCYDALQEIERLQAAKRRALALADERAKECERLRAIVRVNGLQWGHTHAEIDELLNQQQRGD